METMFLPKNVQMNTSSSSSTTYSSNETDSPLNITQINSDSNVTTKDIVSFISDNIVNKIIQNQRRFPNLKRNINDILYSENIPRISIYQFFKRIIKYSRIEDSTLVAIVIYIKRFLRKQKYLINYNNIFNCILGLTVLAIKYNENMMFRNDYYAQIGGIDVKELNKIEYYLFEKIDFKLHVLESEYNEVIKKIFNEKQ